MRWIASVPCQPEAPVCLPEPQDLNPSDRADDFQNRVGVIGRVRALRKIDCIGFCRREALRGQRLRGMSVIPIAMISLPSVFSEGAVRRVC